MANVIDETENLMILLLLFGLIGAAIWGVDWIIKNLAPAKKKPNTAQPDPTQTNPEDPIGTTLGKWADAIWGPNYVPPSTGSVPQRIDQTLWGNGNGNVVDRFFATLNRLFGGNDIPVVPQQEQPANSQTVQNLQTLQYGAPPTGLDLPANPDDYLPDGTEVEPV